MKELTKKHSRINVILFIHMCKCLKKATSCRSDVTGECLIIGKCGFYSWMSHKRKSILLLKRTGWATPMTSSTWSKPFPKRNLSSFVAGRGDKEGKGGRKGKEKSECGGDGDDSGEINSQHSGPCDLVVYVWTLVPFPKMLPKKYQIGRAHV